MQEYKAVSCAALLDPNLASWLADPGFTPGKKHLPVLLQALAAASRDDAATLEQVLVRGGIALFQPLQSAFATQPAALRARLLAILGRISNYDLSGDLSKIALSALHDSDAKTRQAAIRVLGKASYPNGALQAEVERLLLSMWETAPLAHQRSLVEALGKIGTQVSLEWLSQVAADDADLKRRTEQARVLLKRRLARGNISQVVLSQRLPHQALCVLLCRRGLAAIVAAEATARGLQVVQTGADQVLVSHAGSLAELLKVRTALEPALLVHLQQPDSDAALLAALSAESTVTALRAWTNGPVRFRWQWPAGHQRARSWRLAEQVPAETGLINDSRNATWLAKVVDHPEKPALLLVPQAYTDPRFPYRLAAVPAASHPTLAAALAREAEPRAVDRIWDPFVGSGLELVECALLQKPKRLLGTDINQQALSVATENLKAAGISYAECAQRDALNPYHAEISLIVTNPPMGRRVARDGSIRALLLGFLRSAWQSLVPGGRLIWLTPLPTLTTPHARQLGFRVVQRATVDMGGFDAELQICTKPA